MTLIPLSWARHAKRMLTASVTPAPDDWSRFQEACRQAEKDAKGCTQRIGHIRAKQRATVIAALAHANDEARG